MNCDSLFARVCGSTFLAVSIYRDDVTVSSHDHKAVQDIKSIIYTTSEIKDHKYLFRLESLDTLLRNFSMLKTLCPENLS